AEELALAEYQAALSNIRDRKFGAALKGLHEFLVKHPKHAYADNALYWKGEVLYAQRQYGQALVTFEDVVVRFPRGNRVSDAFLKAGLCHARMGNLKNARGYFQRLKSLFPDSVAARMASQEDVR
ncbi:MAG: tol-pal system protein YbgF, partial [Polyangiales bacterium]